jgi:hypothetical protein
MKWAGHVTCMGENMNAYMVSEETSEGRIPSGRCRRRWEEYDVYGLDASGAG